MTIHRPDTTTDHSHRSFEPIAPERPPGDPDVACVTDLTGAVGSILPALDQFNRFEGPDRSSLRSEWAPLLEEPLPEEGVGVDMVLEILRDEVIPRGLRTGHPGFTGWVTTAPATTAAAGHLASAVAFPQRHWHQPGQYLDLMSVRWIIELLGFPSSFVGAYTSGGSTANLLGMGAARQHAAEKLGIDVALDGLGAIPEPRVYASPEVHHVVTRAMGVLGLGRSNLRTVKLDSHRRADVNEMETLVRKDIADGHTPIAIVGNAGDVNTGIVDPLPRMAELAHELDVWFHVDGAYGGWGMLDERVEAAYGDRGMFDSFAVDPHKWLAAPLGTGLTICRDGDLLARAFTIETGAYDRERMPSAPPADTESPWSVIGGTPDWSVDFSTPTRGLPVWAILKEIGAEGMRERVRRHNDFARIVADHARREPELELLSEPQLSIACFRYRPEGWDDEEQLNELNADILTELRRVGRSLPSSTNVDGTFAIRACYINPRNDREHVELLVEDVLEIGRRLSATDGYL